MGWSLRRAWRSASRRASASASDASAGKRHCFKATAVPLLTSRARYTRAMPPSANISSTRTSRDWTRTTVPLRSPPGAPLVEAREATEEDFNLSPAACSAERKNPIANGEARTSARNVRPGARPRKGRQRASHTTSARETPPRTSRVSPDAQRAASSPVSRRTILRASGRHVRRARSVVCAARQRPRGRRVPRDPTRIV